MSYTPQSHGRLGYLRAEKIRLIAHVLPPIEVNGSDRVELLVVGWGGTFGAITTAVNAAREAGQDVSSIHIRHLNPFPPNLGDVLKRFKQVLVAELNAGQLWRLLRSEYLVPAESLSKVVGQPFKVGEIRARIHQMLGGNA